MSSWRRPDAAQLAAFEAFAREHSPTLAVLARGLSPSAASAQDLLQETLVKVLERWEQVASARDPRSYARRMMVNAATSTWRRGRRELHHRSAEDVLAGSARTGGALWSGSGGDEDGDGGAAAGVEAREEQASLLAALRELPVRQRTVVALRYLEQMPDAEIAEVMGVSTGTVRSTSLRALRTLRTHLTDARPV